MTFESDLIPAPHRELIAKGLETAASIDDVWTLFGEAPREAQRPDLGSRALSAAYAVQAEEEQVQADRIAKMAAEQAEQHGRDMASVVALVKATVERPIVVNVAPPPPAEVHVAAPVIPAPIVRVPPAAAPDMTPVAKAFDALREEMRRPRVKTVERDADRLLVKVTET